MPDPHYKALLIGNGIFDRDPHKLSALKGPPNDLRVLRSALTHPQHGLFDDANVKHLLDGTQGEVLEAIELFFSDAGPEDHLLFYYSGHGFPDTNNNLYLCARNTRTTLLGSSAISDKTVNLMAENSRARKFIFMLDCCHSGGFKGGTAGVQLACGSGRCLITACANDQLSADANEATGASTFTHYLAEALTSNEVDSDGDGIVLTSEIFKYVQPRVYNATKQTVQWTMDKTFGEAALSRAARRDPTRPPMPAVTVKTETGRPVLELSETRIEFRDVTPGENLPVERIDVFNTETARSTGRPNVTRPGSRPSGKAIPCWCGWRPRTRARGAETSSFAIAAAAARGPCACCCTCSNRWSRGCWFPRRPSISARSLRAPRTSSS